MSDQYPIPAKTLQLGDQRVSMSYSLLMDLCRMLPDPASAMQLVMTDPVTQDYVIRRVMTPKTIIVKNTDDLIADTEIDFDSDQLGELLTWVVQHILYFFAKRTQGLAKVGAEFKQALPNPSSVGSPASASTEPSLGPST